MFTGSFIVDILIDIRVTTWSMDKIKFCIWNLSAELQIFYLPDSQNYAFFWFACIE